MKKILLIRNLLITMLSTWIVFGVNVASAQPFVYVTNYLSDSVSVIDTVDNTVLPSTIKVGDAPWNIAITPDGSRAYVVNRGSYNVSVIDTATNTVMTTIDVLRGSNDIAITPDGSHAYVTHQDINHKKVLVINTATNTVVATIFMGDDPGYIAITPDGSRAYVTMPLSKSVSVINTATNTIVDTIFMETNPVSLAITPDGSRVYVVNYTSHNVSVINTATNMVVDTIMVGDYPRRVAITPEGSRVYVTNSEPDGVSVINTATNTVVATVMVRDNPMGLAITPDGSRVYVANDSSNNVSVINTATNTLVATVGVEISPRGVAITPKTNTKPVAYAGEDQVITLLNTEIQLDGTGSYDDDGDTITYAWSISQKPTGSSALLSSSTSATPTFIPDVYGDYVIDLTVSDPNETGSTDSVTISFDNVKPVANAGGNKSILVGETAVLDGTGSSDANGDPLTFSWALVSKPAESTAMLSSLTNPTTSFVGDTNGTYDVNLTVNDGLLDSDPDGASILTITVMNSITQILNDAMDTINNIPPEALKNPNIANNLTKKINGVLTTIEKEQYQRALDTLTNDILTKTDGCANSGEPDKDDWIRTCEYQDEVYRLLMEAISTLLHNQI